MIKLDVAERQQKYLIMKENAETLAKRIDKAVEYIEHEKFIKEQVIMRKNYEMSDFQVRHLLDILKGVEK